MELLARAQGKIEFVISVLLSAASRNVLLENGGSTSESKL